MIPRFRPNAGLSSWISAFLPAGAREIERFESGFAALIGVPHALAFPYGRTGLSLLLEALGIRGKEILCPAYTCVVVAHAIMASGNVPVFVDSAAHEYNMDLVQAVGAVTPNTAAILPTSIFGHPVNLDALDAFRAAHPQVRVIQDCALSYDATWNGRSIPREGDAAIFSFNAGKLLYAVFAGMVTTADPALAASLIQVRQARMFPAGRTKRLARRAYLAASLPAFLPPVYGLVHRLTRLGCLDRFVKYFDEGVIDMPKDSLVALAPEEARAGCLNLSRHGPQTKRRRDLAAFYAHQLRDTPGLTLPPAALGATWSHYTVLVPAVLREALLAQAERQGVELGRLFSYAVPELRAYRNLARGDFPNASRLARTVVNLPLCVDARGAVRVVDIIKTFFTGQRGTSDFRSS